MNKLWDFSTARFRVVCTAEDEDHAIDLSWDESGEVAEKLDSGEYVVFCAKVAVYLDGSEIATDYLGECIHADPDDFVTGHRDPDPMHRNCSIMRATRGGNACIGHYFPDMVSTAIREARDVMRSPAPRMRASA